jgi:hypothetical protein
MLTGEDVLGLEDAPVLKRMSDFLANEEVLEFSAAKQLRSLLDRGVCPI